MGDVRAHGAHEESWSTASVTAITGGAYGRAYLGSLQLSAITAVLGAVLGLALAVAVLQARRGQLLRRLVLTASGVLANFGGIPLAFAFIATIGNAGVVTALLGRVGLDGFSLYSMTGLALVYLYFLVPLMVLIIVPALEGLRPQWREASDVLGGSAWQYWRRVGGPVLAPPVIGATMLLFASSFAAYATARPGRFQHPAGAAADRRRAELQRAGRVGERREGPRAGHGGAGRPGAGLLHLGAAAHAAVAAVTATLPTTPSAEMVAAAAPRRRGGGWRWAVLAVLGLYFLVPIAASVWFSIRSNGELTARFYTGVPTAPGFAEAFGRSLLLAALTVVLSLLLMMLPSIALVVGVRSVLAWAPDYFYGTPLAEAFFALQEPALPWILVLVYVVLAMPFVYRVLDAGIRSVDLRTLTEAARNLGASWPRVLLGVVLPVLRTAVLNAAFLTVALVLGEFTIASILGFQTFPTWIVEISGSQPQLSVSVSVLSLLVTWGLLLLISTLDRRRAGKDTP
ncbi:ABC transporter permease subunit [Klenkia sp. LSe6-5]|uniref:ABC transporter permease subunit n=1 Tax=Klenkia sesuvii TaxID=3103137 RepID=A0ABU8DUK8_9ACTN